jgi:hypothetical protein
VKENRYQSQLIKRLERRFPGCVILKNDTALRQGFPDLTLLWERNWAVLEVKASREALEQPNQAHYVHQLGEMSFAAFIYPENEEEVLDALQQAFESPRRARIS